jgi:hypothetical protein
VPNPTRLIVALLVAAVTLSFLRHWACSAHVQVAAAPVGGSWITPFLFGVFAVLFVVGLASRIPQMLKRTDSRGMRERRAEDRLVRHSVRRPAEDVPIEERETVPDADPTLDDDEDDA